MNEIKLNPLQIDMIHATLLSKDKIIGVRAGWGSGKSSGIIFTLLAWSEAHPNESSLLITDTASRFKNVLLVEATKWLIPMGWTFEASNSRLIAPNGHIVFCRAYFRPSTHDSGHNSLEGLNVGFCLIDECQTLNEEVFYKAMGRIRSGKNPKIVLVGLPVFGAWYIEIAEKNGCTPIFYTSHVNKANLGEEWFEAVKALPENERLAMVENQPQPRSGLVYNEFGPAHIVDNWVYNSEWSGRIAIDFGFRKPSVLIIVHDPILEADIIVDELNPLEVNIDELGKLILEKAIPRDRCKSEHDRRYRLDGASGDKAGAARNDQTSRTNFKTLGDLLGINFRWVTDPIRTDIMNGVNRVKTLLKMKKILVLREVWDKGASASGNSFRKAILGYSWDNNEQPKKDGREDPLDALRYDVINFNWRDRVVNTTQAVRSNITTLKPPIQRGQSSFKHGRF
jgi:hypothetical protein